MKASNRFARFLFYLFLSSGVLCHLPVYGQKESTAEKYDVDSALYAYYQRCKSLTRNPIVMQMSDTLFQMAGEKQDTRMQAVALSTKLDHYYYLNNNYDSILHYVNVVKDFSRKNNLLKYYYFAWSSRLVNYHIKNAQFNIALYEAQQMLKQAEIDNYPEGIGYGHNALSNIYQNKNLIKLAIEYAEKRLEIIKQYGGDTYNNTTLYCQLSTFYCMLDQPDKAKAALDEAKKWVNSYKQEFTLWAKFAEYYLQISNYSQTWECLQKAKELLDAHEENQLVGSEYYYVLCNFYKETGRYDQALATQDYILQTSPSAQSFSPREYILQRTTIYEKMGNYRAALEAMKKYIAFSDSLNIAQADIAAGEYATLLEVGRLNTEKNELHQKIQEKDLKNRQKVNLGLMVLLVLGTIMFYRGTDVQQETAPFPSRAVRQERKAVGFPGRAEQSQRSCGKGKRHEV